MSDYYVYIHRKKGSVVYVGKGTKDRAWKSGSRSADHKKFMEEQLNKGDASFVEVVSHSLSEKDAFDLETLIIQESEPFFNKTYTDDWFFRLKTQSQEQAKKRCKQVKTPKGIFSSVGEAAKAYDIAPATMSGWIGSHKQGKFKKQGFEVLSND